MEWYHSGAFWLVNAAVFVPLFFWSRGESREDYRMMLGMIEGMNQEMKDFHGRLQRQMLILKRI